MVGRHRIKATLRLGNWVRSFKTGVRRQSATGRLTGESGVRILDGIPVGMGAVGLRTGGVGEM